MAGNDCVGVDGKTSMSSGEPCCVECMEEGEMLQMRYPSPIAVASVRVRCSDHNARNAAAAAQIGSGIDPDRGSDPVSANNVLH